MFLGFVFICIAKAGGANGMAMNGSGLDLQSEYDAEITSIKIELNIGNVKIKRGETFAIDATNMNKKTFSSFVDDDVWTIKDNGNGFQVFGFDIPFLDNNNSNYSVVIYVPDDFKPEDLSIKLGAGRVELCDMEATNVVFEMGAGELFANQLVIKERSDLHVGAGKIGIKDLTASSVDLDCGLGEMDIKGDIRGESKASCGLGHISLRLSEPESRYEFKVSCGLGSVKLNKASYSFISDSKIKGDDAEYYFKVECGMGSVEVFND